MVRTMDVVRCRFVDGKEPTAQAKTSCASAALSLSGGMPSNIMAKPTLESSLACPNLPSLPTVAMEVLELTRNANVQLTEIADVVQNDPALCAKILKTVNSSFYGLTKPCPTITRALTYLA
jgi:hypothetical protein